MILRAEAIAELLQDKESSDPLAIIPTPKLDDLKNLVRRLSTCVLGLGLRHSAS